MRNKLTNFLQPCRFRCEALVYFDTFGCGEFGANRFNYLVYGCFFLGKKITAHKKAFSFSQEKIIYENFVIQICYIAFST